VNVPLETLRDIRHFASEAGIGTGRPGGTRSGPGQSVVVHLRIVGVLGGVGSALSVMMPSRGNARPRILPQQPTPDGTLGYIPLAEAEANDYRQLGQPIPIAA
jgi:hypothetical protein